MEKLGIFPPNVPIQSMWIVIMKIQTGNKKKFYKKNKNFYSKEDNSSFDMSEDDETKLLFMGIEYQNKEVDDNFYLWAYNLKIKMLMIMKRTLKLKEK